MFGAEACSGKRRCRASLLERAGLPRLPEGARAEAEWPRATAKCLRVSQGRARARVEGAIGAIGVVFPRWIGYLRVRPHVALVLAEGSVR